MVEKRDAGQHLGFAALLQIYSRHSRFSRGRAELPDEAVRFLADQLKLPAADLGSMNGRVITPGFAELWLTSVRALLTLDDFGRRGLDSQRDSQERIGSLAGADRER